jgi:hypothetical protein
MSNFGITHSKPQGFLKLNWLLLIGPEVDRHQHVQPLPEQLTTNN